jgi:hypothetical protein
MPKAWYEKAAEINDQHERENFLRGVFGFQPKEKHPIFAAVIAGYVAGKIASRNK